MKNKDRDKMLLAMCKTMWEQIRSVWGNGWRCLGEEMKRAVITERVFHIFSGRAGVEGYKVDPQEMCEYLKYMLNFCGIDKEGE